jgi:hypothetical protein
VFNLTELLKQYSPSDPLLTPLLKFAGGDASHWFKKDMSIKTNIDPITDIQVPYLPDGRFIDVPSNLPISIQDPEKLKMKPWWQNQNLIIGQLSTRELQVEVYNTLSGDSVVLRVCNEETLGETQERYIKEQNSHSKSYTWKYTGKVLDMNKNLQENGVPVDAEELALAGLDEDEWIPKLFLYFNDDLTE